MINEKKYSLIKVILIVIIVILILYTCVVFNMDSKKNNDVTYEDNSNNAEMIDNNVSKNVSNNQTYDGSLGSAGSIKGTTVIVSIYADDFTTSWNYNNKENNDLIEDSLENLKISTNWLSKQVKEYGETSTFIYDWTVDADLKYMASFDEMLVRFDGYMYNIQKEYIQNNIDTENIKNKYNAENIIYMFFFNTDYSNEVNPWTLGYSSSEICDVEITNMYIKYDGQFIASPSTYAHEILHSFGAHDFYYSNEYINQEYVDYLMTNGSNDIMYTVTAEKDITNEFTEIDAYYVGLKETCVEVEKWNLEKSEHIKSH